MKSHEQQKELKPLIEKYAIVDSDGKPNAILLETLKALELPHDGTLKSIVGITQKKFFQRDQDGQRKERWEINEVMPEFREKIMPLLNNLGMLQEFSPSTKKYDSILILGDVATKVRNRIRYLKDLSEKGLRANKIILLGGERPLMDSDRETPEILLDRNNQILAIRKDWIPPQKMPTTEIGMMKLIWDQAELPQELRKIKAEFINARLKTNPKTGRLDRPTTKDTIEKWLETVPQEGKFLAISNNPHIGYQHSVLKTYLPKGFKVETVGPKASSNLPLAFYLGEITRWLYQENQRLLKP